MHTLTLNTDAPDAGALWADYQRLAEAAAAAGKSNAVAYRLLKSASNEADAERLREQLRQLTRHYLVLTAWVDAFRAAWLFASYGKESLFLNVAEEPRDGRSDGAGAVSKAGHAS